MGFSPSLSLVQRRTTGVYLQLLNEVISLVDSKGDWMELYEEVTTTSVSGVSEYSIPLSGPLKRLEEVRFEGRTAALQITEHRQLRQLLSIGSTGQPNQYNVFGVDVSGKPKIRLFPTPTNQHASKEIRFIVQKRTPAYTTADAGVYPPFPANLLIKGLYYKALIEANDGAENNVTQGVLAEFEYELEQDLNKFTNDTDQDMCFVPQYRS